MNLPKALIILPDYPFPVDNGYRIKTYNFIRSLSDRYDLTVITVTYKTVSDEYLNDFIHNFRAINFINFRIGFFELGFNFIKSLFLNEPIQKYFFSSYKLKCFLKKNNEFPIVFLSTIRTLIYYDLFKSSKIIIDFIDSIGLNYLSSKNNSISFFKRVFFKYEANKLLDYELQSASKASLSLFVNFIEADIFKEKCNNIYHIPNGVKQELFSYDKISVDYSNGFTFIGTMNYQPNIDAVSWFLQNVFDLVNKNLCFYVIGQKPPKSLQFKANDKSRVYFTGFIEDPYLIINSSVCFVAPMQNGAGIQNKVIEAMALGKIVILSKLAAKPFRECEDQVHFIISDDPITIAFYISEIHLNPGKYLSIGINAKNIVRSNYTWDSYNLKLYNLLDNI
jgi:glycosyltransferase involved in cell wall biosynthesis